jgi:hypothetical protein
VWLALSSRGGLHSSGFVRTGPPRTERAAFAHVTQGGAMTTGAMTTGAMTTGVITTGVMTTGDMTLPPT